VTTWDRAFDIALAAARQAWEDSGDVPVGAVVLNPDGQVLAIGANQRELTGDPTAHAEIVALRRAVAVSAQRSGRLQDWRLDGCTLVVTLEPCAMCAGAAVAARLARLVYGPLDPKAGAVASLFDVVRDPRLPHRLDVRGGFRQADCAALLTEFFAAQRSGSASPRGDNPPRG